MAVLGLVVILIVLSYTIFNISLLDYAKVYVATLCRVLEEISEVLNEKVQLPPKTLRSYNTLIRYIH